MRKTTKSLVIGFLLFIVFAFQPIPADGKPSGVNLKGFDAFVMKVIREWQVPGVSIALVKDGQVLMARGYGYRNIGKMLRVTGRTLFAIGSCTKAFTATAVGILVDRGKIEWNKPVGDYLSDFKLKDEVATREMTAVDLMCHRSGLPRHDYSWYNAPVSRMELYKRLQYLEPSQSFRSAYQYNNFMFMTAGLLVERVSGKTWENFISKNIFSPLGMANSNFSVSDSQKAADFSLAYTLRQEKVTEIPLRNIDNIGGAGCINSCAEDMSKWLLLNLNRGQWKQKRIVQENTLNFIQTPQMVTGSSISDQKEFLYSTYGLGWGISAYRGTPVITHGGGIDGFISMVSLLPRHKAGLVVLTNCDRSGGYVTRIIGRNLYDRILGKNRIDWNSKLRKQRDKAKKRDAEAKKEKGSKQIEGTSPSHSLDAYCGRYQNPGYGQLEVKLDNKKLKVIYNGLKYRMDHYHYDIFKAIPELDEDNTYLTGFLTDTRGTIYALSIPLQGGVKDIEFTRVADARMSDPAKLKLYTGEYSLGTTTFTVSLSGDHLVLSISGQPNYHLEPIAGNEFKIGKLSGYSIEFISDASGRVVEVKVIQPDGVYRAKKTK